MKLLLLGILTIGLLGCQANSDDLNLYVAKIKARSYPVNEKVPEIKDVEKLAYTGVGERKPFSIPRPEAVVAAKDASSSCPQPNVTRQKQPLEMFSMDNLAMRGTVGIDGEIWALIQVSGGELHRVKPGYYMGLHHGRIVKVKKDEIELLELVPDDKGCWVERATQLALVAE